MSVIDNIVKKIIKEAKKENEIDEEEIAEIIADFDNKIKSEIIKLVRKEKIKVKR